MKVYGNAAPGGPMTGTSAPLPTAPALYRDRDSFAALERARRVRSPIGPSTLSRDELRVLEGRAVAPAPKPD